MNTFINVDGIQAFLALCRSLDMIRRCTAAGLDYFVDNRGDLFIALRIAAKEIFPTTDFGEYRIKRELNA